MLQVKHTATITVAACEKAIDKDAKERMTKEGKALYSLLVSVSRKQKVGAKEIEVKDFETLTSELELKASDKQINVVLEQYAIADERSKKVNLYYRVIALA